MGNQCNSYESEGKVPAPFLLYSSANIMNTWDYFGKEISLDFEINDQNERFIQTKSVVY